MARAALAASHPTEPELEVGRRQRNKLDKRARILAAARELFSRKGFPATTTAEIAARAGIGAGTLFLYVASKEDLLVSIFHEEMDRVADAAFASLPRRASVLDEIVHVYGALIRFHERDRGLARVFVKELMFVGEVNRASVGAFIDGLQRRTAERIEAAKARGEVDAAAPSAEIGVHCFALYIALLQRWLGLGTALATAEHVARLRLAFDFQLRGFVRGPRPARPSRAPRARA